MHYTNTNAEKQRIINYARERFFREGFYRITVDEIARELSLSKNTFYKHFPNKEKLVFEVFLNFISIVSAEAEAIVKSESNAVQKFITLIHTIAIYLSSINDKLFKDMQLHAPAIWVKVDEMRKQVMMKNLGRLISQGVKEELFKDYPVEIMQTVFITSLRAIMSPDFLMNNKISKQDAMKYSFYILLGGCLTAKGQKIFKELRLPK